MPWGLRFYAEKVAGLAGAAVALDRPAAGGDRIVARMPDGPPIPTGPVTSVAGAIARMEEIGAALPASDGVACFNRMYLEVTQTVGADLGQGVFADPGFMS